MKKSLVLVSAIMVLLHANPGVAAGPSNPPPLPSPPDSMALPPPESGIGDGPPPTAADSLSPTCGVIAGRSATVPHEYPRLSLGTNWVGDWLKKPEGMAFLYRFQEIYTPSASEDVLMIKQRARAENHAAWADSTVWIQTECLVTTGDWQTEPPEWAFGLACNNVPNAINMAVYMNRQLNVDWFLRDVNGQKMPIWGDRYFALNLTPDCPLGVWDGMLTYQGRQYSLGDTRGLTLVQWLKGPFTQSVVRGSLFSQAYDGLQSEDWPSAWLYYFRGQIPDPKRDGIGFPSYVQFEAYSRDVWRSWCLDFLKPLQDKFIIRINNHNTRWYLEGWEDPRPEIQQAANGCKLEGYFGNGGWPMYNRPMWDRVYKAVEQVYHPLSASPDTRGLDRRQGWDVTTVQLTTHADWTSEQIDRYKRAGLASTLMGDGLFDGTAWYDDCYYTYYLRHGMTQYAPRDIPEMRVKLGKALGPFRQYAVDPLHPLDYRQFFDAETGSVYTVVSNVWNVEIAGIPAEDGAWFRGLWPVGQFELLTGNLGKSGGNSIARDTEPTGVMGGTDGGPLALRAAPSVTYGSSRLGLSAPLPSPLELSVFGVSGRLVRTLALAGGQQSVEWDGCDTVGRRVAPGLYFVRAADMANAQTARVTIVR